MFFFFNDTATTEIYTLSLHDALPILERDHHPPRPADLGAGLLVDVLPQHAVVLLVQADGVLDAVRLAAGVVQDGVDVGDVAEAVAPQLQRGGHEPQTPLADVEGGPDRKSVV